MGQMKTNKYDYVDLGLPSGTLWATCNVGANSPTEYGKYFAWGETEGYYDNEGHDFSWRTYKYSNSDGLELTKYNNRKKYGKVDNKLELELNDDAAHVNMGGDWKMPTSAQMKELFNKTNNEWVEDYQGNGVAGRVFTSKSDRCKSIFIPASGSRESISVYDQDYNTYLWSSSLSALNPLSGVCYFDADDFYMEGYRRYYGFSVRGVITPAE